MEDVLCSMMDSFEKHPVLFGRAPEAISRVLSFGDARHHTDNPRHIVLRVGKSYPGKKHLPLRSPRIGHVGIVDLHLRVLLHEIPVPQRIGFDRFPGKECDTSS